LCRGAPQTRAIDHHACASRRPRSPRPLGGGPPVNAPKLPRGAIKPRPSVLAMAPYSPPTAGRTGKLRLDFNENTVGCSPHVIAALKDRLGAEGLAVYPEYGEAKEAIARYYRVKPEQFVFTNR